MEQHASNEGHPTCSNVDDLVEKGQPMPGRVNWTPGAVHELVTVARVRVLRCSSIVARKRVRTVSAFHAAAGLG